MVYFCDQITTMNIYKRKKRKLQMLLSLGIRQNFMIVGLYGFYHIH